MELNHHTIEAWILDWLEGNLDATQEAELHAFVESHPQYLELMEMNDFPVLEKPVVAALDTSMLKKHIVAIGDINETNWEQYFLRYSEQQLTLVERQNVDAFVANNESLKRDFELYKKAKLHVDTTVAFADKDKAKQVLTSVGSINGANWEQYIISAVENQLDSVSQNDVFAFLYANEALQPEYDKYAKAKLKPNKDVVFAHKGKLKKGGLVVVFRDYRNQIFAAAAALLALMGIFWFVNTLDFSKAQTATKRPTQSTIPAKPKSSGGYKLAPLLESSSHAQNAKDKEKSPTDKVATPKHKLKKVEVLPEQKEIATPVIAPEIIEAEVAYMETLNAAPLVISNTTTAADVALIAMQKRKLEINRVTSPKVATPAIKDYTTPLEMAANFIKKKTGLELKKPQPEDDLLVASAEGINKVFNTKWKLERQRDANGDVTAFSFSAGGFEISRNK